MNAFKLLAKGFRRLNSAKAFYFYGMIGIIISTSVTIHESLIIKDKVDDMELTGDIKEDVIEVVKETYKNWIPIAASLGLTSFCFTRSMKKYETMLNIAEQMYLKSEMKRKSLLSLISGTALGSAANQSIIQEENEEQKLVSNPNEKMFLDEYSGQFFISTDSDVLNADKELNKRFENNGSALLSLWYKLLGINGIEYDDKLLWTWDAYDTYGYCWIDILYNDEEDDFGNKYTVIRFKKNNPPTFYNCDKDCWDELRRDKRIVRV